MCLLDTIDWPTVFLGSLYEGRVAIPVNTLLTEDDYRFIMADCRPAVLVVSEALYPKFRKTIETMPSARLKVLVSGKNGFGHHTLEDYLMACRCAVPTRSHRPRATTSLLALHLRLDRQAEGSGARPRRPAIHQRSLRGADP